jgi:hypothetical protein
LIHTRFCPATFILIWRMEHGTPPYLNPEYSVCVSEHRPWTILDGEHDEWGISWWPMRENCTCYLSALQQSPTFFWRIGWCTTDKCLNAGENRRVHLWPGLETIKSQHFPFDLPISLNESVRIKPSVTPVTMGHGLCPMISWGAKHGELIWIHHVPRCSSIFPFKSAINYGCPDFQIHPMWLPWSISQGRS